MNAIDLSGKRYLVMGVTNKRSLGWSIADRLIAGGAELAFTYQGERLKGEVEKLTRDLDDPPSFECDVTDDDQVAATFAALAERWPEREDGSRLDGIVHAIAFAPREALEGRYVDTRREDWKVALDVSAYSLVAVCRAAEPMFSTGAGVITLTYYASQKVVPKYNVMGIAKAALEASVRYLSYDLGRKGVRVNAVSAGPVKTVAARSIPGFMEMFKKFAAVAPLQRNITHEEVGNLGAFLLSPLASGITGEVVYVDAGYNTMGMEL